MSFLLLNQNISDVVSGDVNRISDARDAEDALQIVRLCRKHIEKCYLSRTGQHAFASIKSSTASFLDLLDFGPAFTND